MRPDTAISSTQSITRSPVSRLRSWCSHESLLCGQDMVSITALDAGEVVIKPLHSSILGQDYCIQIVSPGGTRYHSCYNAEERDRWIHSLQRALQPNREQSRRVENSLELWVLEAKGVAAKKRYFCEVYMDEVLYARTSSKTKKQLCFWGEQFEFDSLPAVNTILVKLYREADTIFKKDKSLLIGVVEIRVNTVDGKCMVEKWYPVALEKGTPNKHPPSIRVKCRYQSVDILPIHVYSELLAYITERYGPLCQVLEPIVGVKSKEDIASALVHIMQRQGRAKNLLADLVTMDVLRIDDQRLAFRGNSLATKATECFMRLVGERYLTETLAEPIRCLLESGVNLEVNPLRVTNDELLDQQRDNLRNYVKQFWKAIRNSSPSFPTELRECFHLICGQLKEEGQEHQQDNMISSFIFLRFFCPAILSPSLFNLTQEYPEEMTARNLTLIAKTLQTLANSTKFQSKESYMEFLNDFITEEMVSMHGFLNKISSPLSSAAMMSRQPWGGYVDLGRHLSVLHSLLGDCLPAMCDAATDKSPVERQHLEHALNSVTAALDEPNVALVYQQPPTPTAAGPPTMPGRPPPWSFMPINHVTGRFARKRSASMPVLELQSLMCDDPAVNCHPEVTSTGLDSVYTLPQGCSHLMKGQRHNNDLTISDEYVLMNHLRSGYNFPLPARSWLTPFHETPIGSQKHVGQLLTNGYQSTIASPLSSQNSSEDPHDEYLVSPAPPHSTSNSSGGNVYHTLLSPPTPRKDHPYINRSLKYLRSSSLSSSLIIADVGAPLPTLQHHCRMPPIAVDAPPHPAVSAAGLMRLRRAKAAARRASIEVFTSNECQHCSLSCSSSDPPVPAFDNGAAAAAARDGRPRYKQRHPQRQHRYESFDEYEDELRRLRGQMEELQNRMERRRSSLVNAAVPSPVPTHVQLACVTADRQPPPELLTQVLGRLSQVEKELRHGQSQVSSALEERDRVIQTQNRRIQELNNNNQKLKEMLHRIANNRSDTSDSPATGESKSSDNNVSDTSDCRNGSR